MHTKKQLLQVEKEHHQQLKASAQADIEYWESQPKSERSTRKLNQCIWFLKHLNTDYPELDETIAE
jgi:hypothetical protein